MSSGFVKDFSRSFGSRLAQLRAGRPKTVFGRFLGIFNPSTYQNYEAGRVPDARIVADIARRCDVTVDWLLGIEAEGRPEKVGSPDMSAPDDNGPAKPGSSDMAVREAPRRPFVYPDADDPKPRPEDCAFDARLKAIEGAQARMEAQLSTLTQLLGATLAAPSRSGAAPESERKAG